MISSFNIHDIEKIIVRNHTIPRGGSDPDFDATEIQFHDKNGTSIKVTAFGLNDRAPKMEMIDDRE